MDLEELRAARRQHPFRPFSIRLTDGRTFPVREPESVGIGPGIAVVATEDDAFVPFDAPSLASLEFGRQNARKKKGTDAGKRDAS